MDRGAWQTVVHEVARVGQDLNNNKGPYCPCPYVLYLPFVCEKTLAKE